ncbi:hypothetical protein J6590_100293 [Homalodisca vitripennis]|nr:hypothetical protein J6590_100293 [Homalodisca vitripennis]
MSTHPCLILLVFSMCHLLREDALFMTSCSYTAWVNSKVNCPDLLQRITFRIPAKTTSCYVFGKTSHLNELHKKQSSAKDAGVDKLYLRDLFRV